jgi:hypothetical protein
MPIPGSTLLLTLLLAVGLVFFLRAASKDRTTVVEVHSPRPPLEVLQGLTQWLLERGWSAEDSDPDRRWLSFRGQVRASRPLAVLLSVLAGIGAAALAAALAAAAFAALAAAFAALAAALAAAALRARQANIHSYWWLCQLPQTGLRRWFIHCLRRSGLRTRTSRKYGLHVHFASG